MKCDNAQELINVYFTKRLMSDVDVPSSPDLDAAMEHATDCETCMRAVDIFCSYLTGQTSELLANWKSTKPHSCSCDECAEQLGEYIECEIEGRDVFKEYPLISMHLDQCDSCKSKYEQLKILVESEPVTAASAAGEASLAATQSSEWQHAGRGKYRGTALRLHLKPGINIWVHRPPPSVKIQKSIGEAVNYQGDRSEETKDERPIEAIITLPVSHIGITIALTLNMAPRGSLSLTVELKNADGTIKDSKVGITLRYKEPPPGGATTENLGSGKVVFDDLDKDRTYEVEVKYQNEIFIIPLVLNDPGSSKNA